MHGGISTDHECVTYEYAMEECRNGMQVLIREGSAAKNLEAIVKGIVEHHTDTQDFAFAPMTSTSKRSEKKDTSISMSERQFSLG